MSTRFARLLLFGLLLTLLAACGDPYADWPTPMITVTMPANPTSTATPFLPAGMGGTPAPTSALPPWGNYPAPEITPVSTQIPPPMAPLPQPAGQVTILLLGSDQRPDGGAYRTDTIILMTLKTDGSLSLVSFPRDLYVYIPGWQMQRINTAYPHGGFELLASTFEYNFGIRPQYFILTNFTGFKDIIDSLGGIEVQAASALSDQRDGHPRPYTVGPGTVFMDGETALWYVRSRGTSNDLDRLRRAQEVLVGVGRKLFTLDGLSRVPELYSLYQNTVQTNLSLESLLGFLPLLQSIDPERVTRYAIADDQVIPWTGPESGAELLLPVPDAIHDTLQQAVGAP